jgi:predicted neutral ceramidase superfamily lipid hydrolase
MELSVEVISLVALVSSILVVPIVNFLKAKLNYDGRKAVWLTFGVVVIFAVLVGILGKVLVVPTDPDDLIYMVGIVFTIATLIYKNIGGADVKDPAK